MKLQRVYALRATEDASIAQQWDLTPAQEESLRYAVAMGYSSSTPTTASEVAGELGSVSRPSSNDVIAHGLDDHQLFGGVGDGHPGDGGE